MNKWILNPLEKRALSRYHVVNQDMSSRKIKTISYLDESWIAPEYDNI